MTMSSRSVRMWGRSAIATAINGFASGFVLVMVDPQKFNLDGGLVPLLKTSAIFAAFGLANYLKQHPLPDDEDTVSLTGR
jgi:hypothetical protein